MIRDYSQPQQLNGKRYSGKSHRDLTDEEVGLFFRVVNKYLAGIYRPYSITDASNIARFMNRELPEPLVTPEEVGSLMRVLKDRELTS